MKNKPDDRRDNVEKIQENIDNTIRNMELADEAAANAESDRARRELKDKNDRRREALDGMRSEIRDEASDREKGYR